LFEKHEDGLIELESKRKNYRPIDLINYLSIFKSASRAQHFQIREDLRDELDDFINKKNTKKIKKTYDSTRQITKRKANNPDDTKNLEEVNKLVSLLAQWRADDYTSWKEVGMCLFNINDCLLDTWIEFSKRSPKFVPGECERLWMESFEPRHMGIGSLHRWAKMDSPREYVHARTDFISNHIHRSVSGTTQDVATVVYNLYKYQYICTDSRGSNWMEYRNHRWHTCDGGITLKGKIGNDVLNEYLKLVTQYNVTAISLDNEKKEQWLHRAKALTEITYKLRDMTFKEKVMKECVVMFYDPAFANNLDENPYLIGFENGVYDLKEGCFRNGRPEDCLSLSTGHDFIEYPDVDIEDESTEEQIIAEINDFMSQVFPSSEVRRYVWKMLASFIQGMNPDELFHIWVGVGGNGKSKLLELFEMAFGGYCFKLPVAAVTQKRCASSSAQPEIARTKGLRLGSVQEPDEGVRMNMGIVKEFTGGDKLFARGLYKSGCEFKPQFKLVFLTNFLPKVPSNDEGTWRRLVVIMFNMKFVSNPKAPNERKRDVHLSQKMKYWGSTFMFMLTEWFKIYKKEGMQLPDEITKATHEYRKDSDAYTQFKDEFMVQDPEGCAKLDESYGMFKDWYSKEYNEKPPPRREFKPNMERKLGQAYARNGKSGWTGWSLRHDSDDIVDRIPEIVADIDQEVKPKSKIAIAPKAVV
jgi:P4 family phage/plasmid primase-like protien